MKKLISLLLVFVMVLSLASCGGEKATDSKETQKIVDDDMKLEDLVKAAQDEAAAEGAGKFMVYAPTSRVEKMAKAFKEAYGIEMDYYNESGQDLYTKLTTELEGNVKDTADVVFLQDTYLFETQIKDYDYVINYVPPYVKKDISEEEQKPLVCYYYDKLLIYNNTNGAKSISNVWDLTEESYKGKVFIKDISKESINKNFLAILTTEKWASKLKEAYKEKYGKDIVLDEDCKNAGYQYIKLLLPNVRFGSGDGDIATELSNGIDGNVGLIVYSKLRSDSVNSKNLSVVAYEENRPSTFSGFMYPMYLQMVKTTDRPYTAKLFIYFMMTDKGYKSAFQTKSKDIGTYSANSTIPVMKGDKELSFWKECLVKENNPELKKAYSEGVLDFITNHTSK